MSSLPFEKQHFVERSGIGFFGQCQSFGWKADGKRSLKDLALRMLAIAGTLVGQVP